MLLTPEQLKRYQDDGFLLLPSYFSPAEVDFLNGEIPTIFAEDTPRRVMEKASNTVRSVYASHTSNDMYYRLSRHPRLVDPAMQIVGSQVYIHQFKINAKIAFVGDVWEWHQDHETWLKDDGMPTARVTNAVVFLDEVNEFNGPLLMIPGSHRDDVNETVVDSANADGMGWMANLKATLKYSLDQETVAAMTSKSGIVAPKGPAGSVLFFHGNIAHGSAPNMSPFNRRIAIITYNSLENCLVPVPSPRPEFIASRTFTPIVPLDEDALFRYEITVPQPVEELVAI